MNKLDEITNFFIDFIKHGWELDKYEIEQALKAENIFSISNLNYVLNSLDDCHVLCMEVEY